MPSDDGLTPTQWAWLQCQLLLDDGARICPACAALSAGSYCGDCGAALQEGVHPCENCAMTGTGAFCQYCGHPRQTPVAQAIEADTYDWDAWAQGLTPFLRGITPEEEARLARS